MSAERNDPPQTTPSGGGSPELVVIAKPEAGLRVRASGIASETGADTSSLESVLKTHGAAIRPLFGLSEDRLRAQVEALPTPSGAKDDAEAEPPLDLALYYRVTADEESLDQLAEELLADDLVEAAYVKPAGEPPSATLERHRDRNASTTCSPIPATRRRQRRLRGAPGLPGRGAGSASTRSSRGRCPAGGAPASGSSTASGPGASRTRTCCRTRAGSSPARSIGDTDHGTAVLGVIGGDRELHRRHRHRPRRRDQRVVASATSRRPARSRPAADKLGRGDIILLEIHRPGPQHPTRRHGQLGFIAIEWWPDDFAAIRYAVPRASSSSRRPATASRTSTTPIYDTRPAGLPDELAEPVQPGQPDSGAVVVGAGAPPPNTHGAQHGPGPLAARLLQLRRARRRAGLGPRGHDHRATAISRAAPNQDLWYTDPFSGTSSASPIVVGALACAAGRPAGARATAADPAQARARCFGPPARRSRTPPARPATQRIGNRPNLRELIPARGRLPLAERRLRRRPAAPRCLITSPWGIGILEQAGATMARADDGSPTARASAAGCSTRPTTTSASRRLRRRWQSRGSCLMLPSANPAFPFTSRRPNAPVRRPL